MEAAHTSETSVDNYFIRQYIPGHKSDLILLFENISLYLVLQQVFCLLSFHFLFISVSFILCFIPDPGSRMRLYVFTKAVYNQTSNWFLVG